MRLRKAAALLSIGACAAVVSACGSSSPSGSSATTASTSSSPTASGSATAAAKPAAATSGSPLETVDWQQQLHAGPLQQVSKATVSGNTVKIDVGGGEVITQNKSEPLNIAYFSQGTTNSYLQAEIRGAKAEAKKLGAHITVFNGQFSESVENTQMENALASNEYNAFVGIFVSSDGACKPLTQQAPAKNIIVVTLIQPICGRYTKTGLGMWPSGTVSTINGGGSVAFDVAWGEQVAQTLKEPTEVAYLAGPTGSTDTAAGEIGFREVEKKYPTFKLVAVNDVPGFETAPALSATANIMTAHPNVKVILSQYSDETTGAVQALKNDGKSEQVALWDAGGATLEAELIKKGELAGSAAYWPFTNGACGVAVAAAAHSGQSVPRSIVNECRKVSTPGVETPFFLTPSNVETFKGQY